MDLRRRWLEPSPDGVLSIYLRFDPADSTRRGFEARCSDAIHEARTHVAKGLASAALEAAVAHVRAYVAGVIAPPDRSLVLFAAPDRLLRALHTALVLPTLGRFSTRACVAPLLLADAAEPPGIAVLVDDTQALLLGVRRHRVTEAERVQDLVPARQHQG